MKKSERVILNIKDKIGKLTIQGINEVGLYICNCDCGSENILKTKGYLIGKVKTKSCGCVQKGHSMGLYNKETKTKDFDNTYYKQDNSWIVETSRNDKLYEFIFDDYGINYLKEQNRHLAVDNRGYCYITLPDIGKQYFVHNLLLCGIEYYINKDKRIIDHRDQNEKDNRLINLRITDHFGNTQNAKKRVDNTCGIKGFSIIIPQNRPLAHIKVAVQGNLERISQSFPFSLKGLQQGIEWNYNLRLGLHDEFSSFGFEIHNKTIEEIIIEQSEVFIHNLTEEQKRIFDNDGYVYKPKKSKPQTYLNHLKNTEVIHI